ncbi:MAG TPA: HAMP domain-containing sensor histidine kinase [Thermoanaerobaculia bacterium]|nr:HAMP domain-containing sensor histidine kinase [Thermoanaerobaculia bacterium]
MASKCFMCGREISSGILCERCDKPRRKGGEQRAASSEQELPQAAPPAPAPHLPPPQPAPMPRSSSPAAAPAVALDPFPKAPVVQFPMESASLAITSIVNLLVASGVPTVLLGADRSVKFVSDEAKKLFDAPQSDLQSLKFIEAKTGLRIGELSLPATAGIRIRNASILYSLVPLSGGASGAVLVFRYADGSQSHASFTTYVRETVLGPMRSLRDSLVAASRTRGRDPLLEDSAATVDQVLSSLELAPEVDDLSATSQVPSVTEVVRRVADRFVPFADLKAIHLQVDVQELDETFRDHEQLGESLAIMMDNALHYVPANGQVVIGVRWMEHKGRPLLLFFVMDNGAVVPEPLRQRIFEPDFVWQPSAPERTGRSLFRVREFAVAHSGSVWVESKTGKACTFFLRVRPDGR